MPKLSPTIANVEYLMDRARECWTAYKNTDVTNQEAAEAALKEYRRWLRAAIRLSQHLEEP